MGKCHHLTFSCSEVPRGPGREAFDGQPRVLALGTPGCLISEREATQSSIVGVGGTGCLFKVHREPPVPCNHSSPGVLYMCLRTLPGVTRVSFLSLHRCHMEGTLHIRMEGRAPQHSWSCLSRGRSCRTCLLLCLQVLSKLLMATLVLQ